MNVLEGSHQAGRCLNELARVLSGKLGQDAISLAGDVEDCAAAVGGIFGAFQQVFAHAAVHQLDGAVMPEAQALGRIGDGDGSVFRRAGHLEEQLVLLRLEARFHGGLLAEEEEAAQLEAEIGEGAN